MSDTQLIVETDTSDYALATILSIVNKENEVHLVAFHFHTFTAMELNYYQVQFTPGMKVCENGLRDMHTCGTTLALAYVLYHLSAAWLQFQIIGRSLRYE